MPLSTFWLIHLAFADWHLFLKKISWNEEKILKAR